MKETQQTKSCSMGLIKYHIFQKNEPHISRGTENNHKIIIKYLPGKSERPLPKAQFIFPKIILYNNTSHFEM